LMNLTMCTWWLQYRNLQVSSKCPLPVSRHLLTLDSH
jgi:hypothetical protein